MLIEKYSKRDATIHSFFLTLLSQEGPPFWVDENVDGAEGGSSLLMIMEYSQD